MSGLVRKQQIASMRNRTRKLLFGWHTSVMTPAEMPGAKPTLSGQRHLGRLLQAKANKGVQLFNAPIARVGHIPRQIRGSKQTAIPQVQYPISTTDYNTWYQGRHSAEKREWQNKKVSEYTKYPNLRKHTVPRIEARDHKAVEQFATTVGTNSILEVGNDGRGNPTHILFLKRPAEVPEAPHFWDFPAGLVRANEKPMDVLKKRVAVEAGIQPDEIQSIGPGLKPVSEEVWFALHRIERWNNYNMVAVQRVNKSAEEIAKVVQKRIEDAHAKKDPWAPVAFELIPRTPQGISEFLKRNDKVVMPEVLRLYARELLKLKK